MIYECLQILKEQLSAHYTELGMTDSLVLENIALLGIGGDEGGKVEDKVVLTLIRIEEEVTLKNLPNYKIKNDKTEYRNSPVHLNLYIMIAANCKSYDNSLSYISRSIEFFQGKTVFTAANTVYNRTDATRQVLDEFKFVVGLYTPGFEELNHIWGTLGGRQLPSALYKVQLIRIEQDKKQAEAGVITQISGEFKQVRR
ncbi:MAG: DUF4255 domain-containing protein [Mangrovibacterium sp.]